MVALDSNSQMGISGDVKKLIERNWIWTNQGILQKENL